MSVGIFAIGCLFLIAGVAYLAHLMLLPSGYIMMTVPLVVAVGFLALGQGARDSNHTSR